MRWGLALMVGALGACGTGDNATDAGNTSLDAVTSGDVETLADVHLMLGAACTGATTAAENFVTGLTVLSSSPVGTCTVVPNVAGCTLALDMLKIPSDHCFSQSLTAQCCLVSEVTLLGQQFCRLMPQIEAGMTPTNFEAIASWNPCLPGEGDM